MPRSYYYIVAGLPDILLDSGKKAVDVQDFLSETMPLVHHDDAALFNMLRFPRDNINLLALLEKRSDAFAPGGVYTKDELEEQVKNPDDAIPVYMRAYIESHREGRPVIADASPENQLAWLFYDEACGHCNAFISAWFSFDRDMRNVLSALNCRSASQRNQAQEKPFMLQRAIVGNNDVAQAILKSNAPDFSLSAELPWIERLIGLNKDNLVDYEKSIDTLRWDMLNEMITFSYFQIETICAFTIKLAMVERWQQLDEQAGKEKFDRLVKELTSGFALKEEL
jgi:hypothetical protein